MKKALCVMAMFLTVFFTAACKSGPVATDSSAGAAAALDDADPADIGAIGDVELVVIYSGYTGIILDGAETYTVVYRDTLTKIARKYYGENKGYFFPLIMAASQVKTADPDMIIPGERLVIPDLQANLDDPSARMQLKSLLFDIALIYSGKADVTRGDRRARYLKDRNGLAALARTL